MCRFASDLHAKLPGVELDSQSGMFIEEVKRRPGVARQTRETLCLFGLEDKETLTGLVAQGSILS